jgi:hypothetical protein
MSDCTECKWWMTIDGYCLLGRSPDRCNNNPARRGDDELADRLLGLPESEREDLKRRLTHADDNLQQLRATEESPEGE